MSERDRVIICERRKDCADPHPHRWFCMRGFDLDDNPGIPGVCPTGEVRAARSEP